MRALALACFGLILPACRAEPPAPLPSPSGAAIVAQSTETTGHPRMWLTTADLPRLRAWANPHNPIWERGLKVALASAVATYDREFFPGGAENPKWPDPGIDNWVGKCTEAYAEFFAFASLIDPDPAARKIHAERARRLLMHVIGEAEKGADPDRQHPAPFRGKAFALYNRANYWGEAFGLTVDWIHPVLSAADKASIRRVFMRWGEENLRAATSGEEHPEPVGRRDDPRLLADRKRLRWAANNYYTAHMRHLTLMGLALDEADDPPLDPSAPPGKLGNTLRSYLDDAIGAWLYQQYAVYEEPKIAAAALGVPEEGLGAASGGLSPEGFLYGASIGSLHQALLALHTAGRRDPKRLGPQIGLVESEYWERYLDGILHSLAPLPERAARRGLAYPLFGYGDTLRVWLSPEHAPGLASVGAHAAMTGRAGRLAKARWLVTAAMEGGAERVAERVAGIWGNGQASAAILTFMLLDPGAQQAADPRPALPTVFRDRAIGRIVARTGWGADATVFDHKCTWATIGHQFGDCNQIELYRKGEWLIKERSGYANDLAAALPENHNTVSIQHGPARPSGLQWFEESTFRGGGQWGLGQSVGDPTARASFGEGWVFAEADAEDLYNRRGGPADVALARRRVVWLPPDRVVLLDRVMTASEGTAKRFHLTFVGEPAVNEPLVTVTTARGQRLFVRTLLPAGAKIQATRAAPFDRLAEGEPTRFRMTVEDPKSAREVRFLHVLEGADAGVAAAPARLVESSEGRLVGAVVGESAVMFAVAPGFERAAWQVPAGTTRQVVTGLSPGGGYEVSVKREGGVLAVRLSAGAAQRADEAGVLVVGLRGDR